MFCSKPFITLTLPLLYCHWLLLKSLINVTFLTYCNIAIVVIVIFCQKHVIRKRPCIKEIRRKNWLFIHLAVEEFGVWCISMVWYLCYIIAFRILCYSESYVMIHLFKVTCNTWMILLSNAQNQGRTFTWVFSTRLAKN